MQQFIEQQPSQISLEELKTKITETAKKLFRYRKKSETGSHPPEQPKEELKKISVFESEDLVRYIILKGLSTNEWRNCSDIIKIIRDEQKIDVSIVFLSLTLPFLESLGLVISQSRNCLHEESGKYYERHFYKKTQKGMRVRVPQPVENEEIDWQGELAGA